MSDKNQPLAPGDTYVSPGKLVRLALEVVPLEADAVEAIYDHWSTSLRCRSLCVSHERLRAEVIGAEAVIADQARELKARGEILDTIQQAAGTGWWLGCADWRQSLRAFAEDNEQHQISAADLKDNSDGVHLTLYAHGGHYVAYLEDAAILWNEADDDLPMFHVMVKSDPPHRTCIHRLHLANWMDHLAERRIPVRVVLLEDLEAE